MFDLVFAAPIVPAAPLDRFCPRTRSTGPTHRYWRQRCEARGLFRELHALGTAIPPSLRHLDTLGVGAATAWAPWTAVQQQRVLGRRFGVTGCVTAQGIAMPARQAAITGGASSQPTGAPNNNHVPNKTTAEARTLADAPIADGPAPPCTMPSMDAAISTPASVPSRRPKKLPRRVAIGSTTCPNRPPERVPHAAPAMIDLLKTSRRGRGIRGVPRLVIRHRHPRNPSRRTASRIVTFYGERNGASPPTVWHTLDEVATGTDTCGHSFLMAFLRPRLLRLTSARSSHSMSTPRSWSRTRRRGTPQRAGSGRVRARHPTAVQLRCTASAATAAHARHSMRLSMT